jgi:SWI/SNF-related matrix-associated actin-dependent regulator of chromatin subfamily A-like protein 1
VPKRGGEIIVTSEFDYQVKIDNVRDLELFANCIKDAVCHRMALSERFSAIRLQGAPLIYNDFVHKRRTDDARGITRPDGTMEVAQRDSALQLAGTVVHEMAHVLVGVQQQHNENWQDACLALGLTHRELAQVYKPEDFAPALLTVIRDAILKFRKDYPNLVYDPLAEIPWPVGIGTPACDCAACHATNGCEACKHTDHVMQFQIDGIREMLARAGNILLADEMGLGKTVEAMGYVNVARPTRMLVGCPNNAKLIWKRHFEKWCIHPYDVEIAYTNLYTFGDVVIMNYEALVKWGDALKTQDWDLIIYDEGHYLKTPSAKRSRAAYAVHGKKAIIITGTPIVNYPYELFPLIHYLDRQNWPEYGRFEYQFGSRSSDRLGRNLNRLNAMLRATIMTRRLKKDVLSQLPRKRRQIVEFEVSDNIRQLIETEKKLFNSMQEGATAEQVAFLNAMRNESDPLDTEWDWAALIEDMKYTRKYAFEEMAKIAHQIGKAKLPLVIEHIENALEAREKVVVFGHHRDVLTGIADRFKPGSVLLLGGNRDQALSTDQAVNRFNDDEECKVFVGQVSIAQGYSIKGSSTVIFVEEDWVPGIMTQAEDRAHGIGRGDAEAKSMLIQHLVFENSLDTYKAKLTIKKQKSIDRAVGNVK